MKVFTVLTARNIRFDFEFREDIYFLVYVWHKFYGSALFLTSLG